MRTNCHLERAESTTKRIQENKDGEAIEEHKKNMEFERQLLEQREEIEKACEHEKAVPIESKKAAPLESTQLKSSGAVTLPKLSNTKLKSKVKIGYLSGEN